MNLKNAFAITSIVLALSACCGGGKKDEPASRWDKPTGAAGAGGAAKPTTTPAKDPPKDAPKDAPKDPPKGAEAKPVDAGVLNKYMPPDGTEGSKRTFKADKPAYAEASYKTKDNKELTVTINDLAGKPDERAKFKDASDKLSGNPYKTFGKNKSQILVGDRFQVDAFSPTVDEATRKTFLSKVDLSGLAAQK